MKELEFYDGDKIKIVQTSDDVADFVHAEEGVSKIVDKINEQNDKIKDANRQMMSGLDLHTSQSDKHVTANDKSIWNAKWNEAAGKEWVGQQIAAAASVKTKVFTIQNFSFVNNKEYLIVPESAIKAAGISSVANIRYFSAVYEYVNYTNKSDNHFEIGLIRNEGDMNGIKIVAKTTQIFTIHVTVWAI